MKSYKDTNDKISNRTAVDEQVNPSPNLISLLMANFRFYTTVFVNKLAHHSDSNWDLTYVLREMNIKESDYLFSYFSWP